ncbi:hypothetical protein TSACC_23340 [Terrimicrobium sacchariphilum]|uniref:Uncharacterized protein n=1 Tax=Terrimicrobium sacchariphilum TaxID=690879 RepID=A0A146GEK0_TERSA|nr:hypothetical protein TSACC_23340 [Terrimicrobium sacchariphilum]
MGTATRSECELDQIRNEKGQIDKGFNGEFDLGGRECDRRSGAESESGGDCRLGSGEGESLAGCGHCGCGGKGESLAGCGDCCSAGGCLSFGGCVHRIQRGYSGPISCCVRCRSRGDGCTFSGSLDRERCGDGSTVCCCGCCRIGSGSGAISGNSCAVCRGGSCSIRRIRDCFGNRRCCFRWQRRGAGRLAWIRLHHVQPVQFHFQFFTDADSSAVRNSNSGTDAHPHADACFALLLGRTC